MKRIYSRETKGWDHQFSHSGLHGTPGTDTGATTSSGGKMGWL